MMFCMVAMEDVPSQILILSWEFGIDEGGWPCIISPASSKQSPEKTVMNLTSHGTSGNNSDLRGPEDSDPGDQDLPQGGLCDHGWSAVQKGLTLKLAAMWLIFPSLAVPYAFLTPASVSLAALMPLLLDLAGRCLCLRAPILNRGPIRFSVIAQIAGIAGLLMLSFAADTPGVIIGLIWAAVCQASAAKWFVRHLQSIALELQAPQAASAVEQLRGRLVAATLSTYGTGVMIVLVLTTAIFVGLMTWGIGWIFTIPVAFVLLMPLVTSCMVLYFLMLRTYEKTLSQLRQVISRRGRIGPSDYAPE